jgi:hypothetical protein
VTEPAFPTFKVLSSCSLTEVQQRKEEQVEGRNTTKKTRPCYPEAFEAFWRAYPTTKTMSKKTANDQFAKLTAEDQQAATAAIPAYKAELAKNTWQQPVHACRYLSQRRFDSFAEPPKPPQAVMPIDLPDPLREFWARGWRIGMAFSPPMKRKCAELEDTYGHRSQSTGAPNGSRVLHQGGGVSDAASRPLL